MSPQPNDSAAGPAPADHLGRVLSLIGYLRVHCPWDARQTATTLVPHLLEEAHEVAEAIRDGADAEELATELGDLLLNVGYQIVVAAEEGRFDAERVVSLLENKMVRRHPHVDWSGHAPLSDGAPAPPEAQHAEPGSAEAWEARKAAERGPAASALDGIARGLDPLIRAHRLQERAASQGFDWPDVAGPLEKVAEELAETRAALDERADGAASPSRVEEEVGDLLFACVNLARLAGVHGANALATANAKFARRYRTLEERLRRTGLSADQLSPDELDAHWDAVKALEETPPPRGSG
ncbi:MAG: nucleoside triphosphate pyrophosphohydrolase [Gemmatimonadota bacterium]